MSTENLWGDIPLDKKILTPGAILDAQVATLEQKTNGLLTARVARESMAGGDILLFFRIVAPLVGGYEYEVCRVVHDIALYPVQILDASEQVRYKAEDEVQFKKLLSEIFQKAKVRKVITSLIAQSQ